MLDRFRPSFLPEGAEGEPAAQPAPSNRRPRPIGVAVVAGYHMFAGAALFVDGLRTAVLDEQANLLLMAIGMALGLAIFVLGFGVLRRRRWARIGVLLLSVVSVVLGLAFFVLASASPGTLITVIAGALSIWILTQPQVQAWYSDSPSARATPAASPARSAPAPRKKAPTLATPAKTPAAPRATARGAGKTARRRGRAAARRREG